MKMNQTWVGFSDTVLPLAYTLNQLTRESVLPARDVIRQSHNSITEMFFSSVAKHYNKGFQ